MRAETCALMSTMLSGSIEPGALIVRVRSPRSRTATRTLVRLSLFLATISLTKSVWATNGPATSTMTTSITKTVSRARMTFFMSKFPPADAPSRVPQTDDAEMGVLLRISPD